MGIITDVMNERCVWWERNGTDDYGQARFNDPVELDCRWDEEYAIYGREASEFRTETEVMVPVDMTAGDYLKRGTLAELTYPNDPKKEGAKEIIGWSKVPDFDAQEFLRVAHM